MIKEFKERNAISVFLRSEGPRPSKSSSFSFENLETAHQCVIYTHQCSCVIEVSTVIRRREYRHELSLREELIAILNYLMSPTDQIKSIFLQEFNHFLSPELIAHSSFVILPTNGTGTWVTP